jgi:hypothetical protein
LEGFKQVIQPILSIYKDLPSEDMEVNLESLGSEKVGVIQYQTRFIVHLRRNGELFYDNKRRMEKRRHMKGI